MVTVVTCICALSLLVSLVTGICEQGITERIEHRDMSQAQWDAFANAYKQLNVIPSTRYRGLSKLEEYAQIHLDQFQVIHTYEDPNTPGQDPINPIFLAWHRFFIYAFEKDLQRIDPKVTLPYWDESIDFNSPEKASVFNANRIGGTSPTKNGEGSACIKDSLFASVVSQRFGCIKRGFTRDGKISQQLLDNLMPTEVVTRSKQDPKAYKISLASGVLIQSVIDSTKGNFQKFSEAVEFVIHPIVHIFAGGNLQGTMNNKYSPIDPVFWLHHAFIDRIWAHWQIANPGTFDFGTLKFPAYETIVAGQVADMNKLCYKYRPPKGFSVQPMNQTNVSQQPASVNNTSSGQNQSESVTSPPPTANNKSPVPPSGQSDTANAHPLTTSNTPQLSKVVLPLERRSLEPKSPVSNVQGVNLNPGDDSRQLDATTQTSNHQVSNGRNTNRVVEVQLRHRDGSLHHVRVLCPAGYPAPVSRDFEGFLMRPVPSQDRVVPLLSNRMILNMGYNQARVQNSVQYVTDIENRIEHRVSNGQYVPAFSEPVLMRQVLSGNRPVSAFYGQSDCEPGQKKCLTLSQSSILTPNAGNTHLDSTAQPINLPNAPPNLKKRFTNPSVVGVDVDTARVKIEDDHLLLAFAGRTTLPSPTQAANGGIALPCSLFIISVPIIAVTLFTVL